MQAMAMPRTRKRLRPPGSGGTLLALGSLLGAVLILLEWMRDCGTAAKATFARPFSQD